MKELILSGTSAELKSPAALKILAAAIYAGVPLQKKEGSGGQSSSSSGLCPPGSGGLVLSNSDSDDVVAIGTSHAAMRYIGNLAPASDVLGQSELGKAHVDGWCSFSWSSLALPLQVLVGASGDDAASNQARTDVTDALHQLDRHLQSQTYMVGQSVTLADIALVVSLYTAVTAATAAGAAPIWDREDTSTANVTRWYDTLTHQEWFEAAVKARDSSSTTVVSVVAAASSSGASAAAASGAGVLLHGPPVPVVNTMYRRHRIRIKELVANDGQDYMDQQVTVAGWARTVRKQGKLLFIELNDGSTGKSLQCVMHEPSCEGFSECKSSGGTGASFSLEGKLVSSQGGGQAVELQVAVGKLLGAVYAGNKEGTEVGGMLYPMSKKEHTLEHMRDNAHLRPRAQTHAAAMRVRHAMAYATHNFFHNHGFLYIHTPIITGADCEGAGEQFGVTTMLGSDHLKPGVTIPVHQPPDEDAKPMSKSEMKRLKKKAAKVDPTKPVEETVIGAVDYSTDFFNQRVNLTVSGQLNVETHACALSDVYTFGPTFRAEESYTGRHLSEFWMIEPEIAFADLADDINLAEDYLKYCVQFALENCVEDLEFFENSPHGEKGLRDRLRNVLENPFKRITYTEAIEILQKAVADGVEFEVTPEWGIDLPTEHERYICEKVFGQPVVLTDYPKEIKAFYMKLSDDERTVAAADILVPKIGEIIGGSQREERLDVLKRRCTEMNLDPRSVWWYLDLRRFGTIPHSGFGLGFERLIMFITGLANIRDVIPFPRWAGNAKF